ncbi:hypothetical protein [Actinoplanes siamensis]|uniref:Uncharacterized protein n=1 Tax=Actinoplanes siamensis TaxID=1223317 RepID=A0A919N9T6_9ACTN|nr:hypothetical protein [Actinoplanes siamensis]GIF06932.1 hypothetical protein Asi03nite_44700 [Actinoplanes siamensis]
MDNLDDWVAFLRAAATALDAGEVLGRLDETTATDPRDDDLAVLVTGRGSGPRRMLARLGAEDAGTVPVVPAGTRWSAAPALDLVGGTARTTAERLARHSDVVIHVVPATASIDGTDRDFLAGSVVAVAHVPVIAVVVADLDRVEPVDRDPLMTYVRDAAGTMDERIAVGEWPGDDFEDWWRRLLPGPRPARSAQRLAQLADCADAVAEAATRAVERARQQAPDEHLGTAGRLAARSLDAAQVRRELRKRQETAVGIANASMTEAAERLAAVTTARIRAAGPDGVDAVLDRFPAEAIRMVDEVQESFARTVAADVAWFDERLTALFEAMGAAGRPGLVPRTPVASRPVPAYREALWITDKVTPLAGMLSRFGTRLAIGLIKDKLGGDASRGLKRVAFTAVDGSTDVPTQVGRTVEGHVAAWLERWDRSRRTEAADRATRAATGLLVRENDLAEAARVVYDGLADEFDKARGGWQEPGDRAGQPTAAEVRARSLAERARTVSLDIHRAIREAR